MPPSRVFGLAAAFTLLGGAVVSCAAAPAKHGQTPEVEAVWTATHRSEVSALTRMCTPEAPLACAVLGWWHLGKSTPTGRALLEDSCVAGEMYACWELGRFLEATGSSVDASIGSALVKRACDGGFEVCPRGRYSVSQFQAAFADYLETRCREGAVAGCLRAGTVLIGWEKQQTRHEPDDFTRAAAAFAAACERGVSTGCLREGYLHDAGLVSPVGVAAAVRLYERACAMKDEVACTIARERSGGAAPASSTEGR